MIDHLVFLAVREDASPEDVEDLISSIRRLRDTVPAVVEKLDALTSRIVVDYEF